MRSGDIVTSNAFPEELSVPVLPIRNSVVFPVPIDTPLRVIRKNLRSTMDVVKDSERRWFVALAQRDPKLENPGPADRYSVGSLMCMMHCTTTVGQHDVEMFGLSRVKVTEWLHRSGVMVAKVRLIPALGVNRPVLMSTLRAAALNHLGDISEEFTELVEECGNLGMLSDLVATNLPSPVEIRQSVLEIEEPELRARVLLRLLGGHLEPEVSH